MILQNPMMGIFTGVGAEVVLQLGFIPSYFKMYALPGADPETHEWAPMMCADDLSVGGIMRPEDGSDIIAFTLGTGIQPYYGGELLTITLQPTVV